MNYFVRIQSGFPCSLKDNSLSFLPQENLKFKELVEGRGGAEKEKDSKQAIGQMMLLWSERCLLRYKLIFVLQLNSKGNTCI